MTEAAAAQQTTDNNNTGAPAPGEKSGATEAETRTDWKAESRKWEQRAKENHAKLQEAAPKLAEYDKLVESQKTNEQKLTDQLTREQAERTRWQGEAVAAKVQALASADFADPDDAVRSVDPSKYLDAGGTIDEAAIKADLTKLLEAKPHYRRPEGTTARVPAPNTAQGTSNQGSSAQDARTQFAAVLGSQLNR